MLRYLGPQLWAAGKVGRIYYPGFCQPTTELQTAFPKIHLRPPPEGQVGLSAIRYIFGAEKRAAISNKEPGIVRIIIGDPPRKILSTKIAEVRFSPMDQYNADPAIGAIQEVMKYERAMRRLNVTMPLEPTILPVTPPMAGLPHLPPVLKDVTMDRALSTRRLATTWNGIVLYGACSKSHSLLRDVCGRGSVSRINGRQRSPEPRGRHTPETRP